MDNVVSPYEFGAKFDGVTDDSAAIQAAIDSAAGRLVVFPDKKVTRARFTLQNYTRIEGNGTRVEWASEAVAIVTVPSQGAIQTVEQSYIRNLNIDGVNTTAGSVGLAIGNHAAFWFEGVNVDRCDTGIRILSGQFCNGRSFRVRRCNVGLYMKSVYEAPGPGPGGGNSWSLHDGIFDQNKVSVLLYRDPAGNTPMHSNYLRNCLFMDSEITGLACFNVTHLTVDGGAPEYTGGGASTYAYDGLTIKSASAYLNASVVEFENFYCAEGTIDPMMLCEESSRAIITNISGYGLTSGQFIDCDSTSFCTIAGAYNGEGSLNGAARFDAMILNTQAAVCSTFFPKDTPGFPNIISSSQAPAFSGTEGTAGVTTGSDSVYGNYNQITWAAAVGNVNSHRVRRSITTVGTFLAVAFCVQSDIDETIRVQFNTDNVTPRFMKLNAGVWHRVFWMSNGCPSSAGGSLIITPESANGAVMKFNKWGAVTGTLTPQVRAFASAMASGLWRAT